MIAHFIGLCKGPEDMSSKYAGFFNSAENLILGEILFEFPDCMTEMCDIINDYKNLYIGLAKILNVKKDDFKNISDILHEEEKYKRNCSENIDKILVLDKALTYQGLLKDNPDYELDEKVKKFYQF